MPSRRHRRQAARAATAPQRALAARGDYGSGTGGYGSSKSTSLQQDWTYIERDQRDLYTFEANRISARTEDLVRNNPYAAAIIETITAGAIGPKGLLAKSLYQEDESADTSDNEQMIRDLINLELAGAFEGTAFDAGGQLARRDMSVVMLAGAATNGDSFSSRVVLPDRPGFHTHATCQRLIHASRVCNPGFGTNSLKQYEGFVLDDHGTPVAITVLRTHPASVQYPSLKWDTIPIFGDFGLRNVCHLKATRIADSLRGISWMAPILVLLQHLGKTTEAYVVAKRIQSCNVYVVEADDPTLAAAADIKGAVLGPNTKVQPGKVYYVKRGTAIHYLDGKFQGQDFKQFTDVLITALAASLNLPAAFVMNELTKSNLASARAALMQAWATFTVIQELQIVHVEQPWCESVVLESWLRGRLPISQAQLRRAFRFGYTRPAQAFPDPAREIAAAEGSARLGVSPETIFARLGLDFELEVARRERNVRLLDRKGMLITDFMPVPPATAGTATAVVGPAGAQVDADAGTAYDPAQGEETEPASDESQTEEVAAP